MTAPAITLTLRCQCHPPITRELPADADRDRWWPLLLLACRRRGCRCVMHEPTEAPPGPSTISRDPHHDPPTPRLGGAAGQGHRREGDPT